MDSFFFFFDLDITVWECGNAAQATVQTQENDAKVSAHATNDD